MTKHARSYKPTAAEDRDTAERAAETIRQHWLSKGVRVKVWIEPEPINLGPRNSRTVFAIRTQGIPVVKS